ASAHGAFAGAGWHHGAVVPAGDDDLRRQPEDIRGQHDLHHARGPFRPVHFPAAHSGTNQEVQGGSGLSQRARVLPARGNCAMTARSMFEKIWSSHVIAAEEGELLLYVDRALIHEGSSHAFAQLAASNRAVARPRQVFAFTDHYVPTAGRELGVDG